MGGRGASSGRAGGKPQVQMSGKEKRVFDSIPKKYREHIVSVGIDEHSGDFNERGQELVNYTVTWDNGDEHTFQNQAQMKWAIKENTDSDGYYYG